jgi:RES domain-containing protein
MRQTAWRLMMRKYAGDPLSGEGARIHGGRWNSKGIPVVYAGEHISLTVLEVFVNLEDIRLLDRFVLFRLAFDENLVQVFNPEDLPEDWRGSPPPPSTQMIGNMWVRDLRSAVLSIPSVVIPAERNFVINPKHPDFGGIEVSGPHPLDLDPRLIHR